MRSISETFPHKKYFIPFCVDAFSLPAEEILKYVLIQTEYIALR